MTFKKISSFTLLSVFAITACTNSNSEYTPKTDFNTMEDSVSYAVGFQNGNQLTSQGFPDVDIENFFAGFKDGLAKNDSELADANLQDLFGRFGKYLLDKIKVENLEEGRAFLAENIKKEGVVETTSGIQHLILEEGTGISPTAEDSVVIHYEGTLIDGTIFDSSYSKGTPSKIFLGAMVPGFTEGISLMKEGETAMLYIPAELGYGENPRPGGAIQPNDLIIFKVELIEVR